MENKAIRIEVNSDLARKDQNIEQARINNAG
jgi:hypothetical protein